MPKSLAVLSSAVALAVGVAACGSSSSGSTSAATAAATTPSSSAAAGALAGATTKLAIAANPSGALMFSASTLSAKAGTVQITFTNKSTLAHNLTVQQGSAGSVIAATPTFSGGSKVLVLHLKAGAYTYFCSVPGHRESGMHGLLTVS